MKRFLILTVILLIGLLYFGIPGSNKQQSSSVPSPIDESYSPWSNEGFEKIHRSLYFKDAIYHQIGKKKMIPLDDISPSLQQAVITMEDRKFYTHSGFDWEGILRAGLINLQKGEIEEGASTITQQLAKNLFLSQEQNWSRKAEELALAIQIENTFTKEEIFSLYLNTIYFGSNAYGIEEASNIYFDKTPMTLTLAEAAMLAGVLPAPSLYSPYENFDLAKERQKIVLDTMQKNGIITPKQAADAKESPIHLKSE